LPACKPCNGMSRDEPFDPLPIVHHLPKPVFVPSVSRMPSYSKSEFLR
jgi:hypothetical protein